MTLSAIAVAAQAHQTKAPVKSANWMLEYDTPGRQREIRTDPRLQALLVQGLKQHQSVWLKVSLPTVALDFVDVHSIGESIIKDHRYAVITGCVRHMCPDHFGVIWVDTKAKEPAILFTAFSQIAEENSSPNHLLFHAWIFSSYPTNADPVYAAVNPKTFPESFLNAVRDEFGSPSSNSLVSATIVEPDGTLIPVLPESLTLKTSTCASSTPVSQ